MPGEVPVAAAPAPTSQTQTETTPATSTPPAQPAHDEWREKYKKLEADSLRERREHITERRKWDAGRPEVTAKLARLAELEKREQHARLNPPAFLKSIYGDDWHTVVQEAKLNGVPPAQLLQDEMGRMREEFEQRLKARDEQSSKAATEAQQRQVEQVRQQMRIEGEDWYDAHGKDFPILEDVGDKSAVAKRLAEHIEAEFHRTSQRDESGNVVRQGRILTIPEAAEAIEAQMLATAERAFKADKYKARWQPKPTDLPTGKAPATVAPESKTSTVSQSSTSKARQTLTTTINGSTKADTPPSSPEERRKRALEAYNAERARKAAVH